MRVSWDVFIMQFPVEPEEVTNIPPEWEPPALGTSREVRAVLMNLLPNIGFAENGWGDFQGPGFLLSTKIDNDDEPVDCVTLFVRGDSSAAAHAALAIMEALEARAIDTKSGDFLMPDSAESTFDSWRAYRDAVLVPRRDGAPN